MEITRSLWEERPGKVCEENPLPSRDNYILSSTLVIEQEISGNVVKTFESVETLDAHIKTINKNYDDVWIIGGAGIYKEYLENQKIDTCYVTHVNEIFDCDTFFPELSRRIEWFKIEITKYEKYKPRSVKMRVFRRNEYRSIVFGSKYLRLQNMKKYK